MLCSSPPLAAVFSCSKQVDPNLNLNSLPEIPNVLSELLVFEIDNERWKLYWLSEFPQRDFLSEAPTLIVPSLVFFLRHTIQVFQSFILRPQFVGRVSGK